MMKLSTLSIETDNEFELQIESGTIPSRIIYNAKNSVNAREIISLAWCCAAIVASASIAAIYHTTYQQPKHVISFNVHDAEGNIARIIEHLDVTAVNESDNKNVRISENDDDNIGLLQPLSIHSSGDNDDESTIGLFNTASKTLLIDDDDYDPLFPLKASDYYGFAFAIVGLMIAAGGGIGGGGILVPIYMLVMGFSPKHAIPLSNVTIVGGAIANTLLNIRKRHPLADRPLIDYDLILVMVPLTLLGALLGAFLNKILPELLLVILLVILLSFTAWTTLEKAIKMYQKETNDMASARPSELTRILEVSTSTSNDSENYESIATEEPKVEMNKTLQAILEEERHTPVCNLMLLIGTFTVVLIVNLLKGGGAFKSPLGIECGSTSFWMVNAFLILWISALAIYIRYYLVKRYSLKKSCGYQYPDGDIQWCETNTILYPLICCFAGFFAGMFGIGGGIITGPLILAMGVHPEVNQASSAFMILFTALTATTSFVVFGLLIPDYAAICFAIGFVATLAGHAGLEHLMKKSKRNSYIAFSIGLVVLISAILMTIQSVLTLIAGEHDPSSHRICSKK